MRRHLLPLPLLLCTCLGDPAPGGEGAAPDGDAPIGGALALPACGYAVVTRDGATAPRPAPDRLGADPTPFAVHLGLSGDPARSINVLWRTRDEETLSTRVQFGEGDALDQLQEGLTFTYEVGGRAPVRMHEAHLCGLKPGTRYRYRVGGSDGEREAWSPTYSFRTAPDPRHPPAPVLLGVLGDTRGGTAYFGQALQRVAALGPPDLLLFSGDATFLGTLQSEWDEFFAQGEPVLATIPMLATHGNHEVNAVNYYSQFALPGDEENYSLDYGAARLVVANDSPADLADLGDRTARFLDERLAPPAPWKLLLHHRGLWSSSTFHGSDPTLQALWGPIIDRHRVDLVVSGHDHDYERSKPLRGGVPQARPEDGTTFVVAGSAGAELYAVGMSDFTARAEMTRSFLLIEVRGAPLPALKLRAYRDDGTPLDSLDLRKP